MARPVRTTISGTGANDVWASTDPLSVVPAIYHYDGAWSRSVMDVAAWSIWGSSPTDVYAVSQAYLAQQPIVSRYTGTWNTFPMPGFRPLAVGGSGPDFVVVAGTSTLSEGWISTRDATGWRLEGAGSRLLKAVAGAGPGRAFIVGEFGAIFY